MYYTIAGNNHSGAVSTQDYLHDNPNGTLYLESPKGGQVDLAYMNLVGGHTRYSAVSTQGEPFEVFNLGDKWVVRTAQPLRWI